MLSYQYSDSHVKDKTVSPTVLSLTWESPYLGKTVFILRQGPGLCLNIKTILPGMGFSMTFTGKTASLYWDDTLQCISAYQWHKLPMYLCFFKHILVIDTLEYSQWNYWALSANKVQWFPQTKLCMLINLSDQTVCDSLEVVPLCWPVVAPVVRCVGSVVRVVTGGLSVCWPLELFVLEHWVACLQGCL